MRRSLLRLLVFPTIGAFLLALLLLVNMMPALAEGEPTPDQGSGNAAASAAVSAMGGVADTAGLTGKSEDTGTYVAETVGMLVNSLMGLLGIVFMILVIYAGFLWMTAGGNLEQVSKAKKLLVNGVIGLIIIMAAYSITDFVIYSIWSAT